MELQRGVYVSSLEAHDWQPDPEVGGEMHVLCSGVGVELTAPPHHAPRNGPCPAVVASKQR